MNIVKKIPNILTCIRIIGSVSLVFIDPFTTMFYITYTVCGISDVLDGYIARKAKCESAFGSKLDSISDIMLYTVMLLRIFKTLLKRLPVYVWFMVISALLIRCASYISAAIKFRCFASIHTYLNKATGFGVFAVPYFINTSISIPCSFAVSILAILSSSEELIIHLTRKKYNSTAKTIFALKD